MKVFILGVICLVAGCYGAQVLSRLRRQAYELPDGAELVAGPIATTFRCDNQIGYFADIANGCRIFHICEPRKQTSYICGNLTVFNQITFTCAPSKRAIPCPSSADFFYLNSRIGDPKALLLTPDDIRKVSALTG